MDLGYNFKLQSAEDSGDMCFHPFWKLTGEIKNLKNEVINLKDEIMKMSAAKDRENYSSEILSESLNGR